MLDQIVTALREEPIPDFHDSSKPPIRRSMLGMKTAFLIQFWPQWGRANDRLAHYDWCYRD